ncbi:MAG: LysE family translocator [Cellvibrionaceae bacterium]
MIASTAHGLGVGFYAALVVLGLGVTLQQSPTLFSTLQYAGAVFLAYLGVKSLLKKQQEATKASQTKDAHRSFSEGFLIAFLNPKIALFFLALFSQLIHTDADWLEKTIMATTAAVVDGLWYCLVVLVITTHQASLQFNKASFCLSKIFGILLIVLALKVIFF